MLRLFRSVWIWVAYTAMLLTWLPIMAVVRLLDRDAMRRSCGRWLRVLGRGFTRVYPGRILIEGLDNIDRKQAYMIVVNHQSLADGPLTSHVPLDQKALFRSTLFEIPVVGWLLKMAGEIAVDRSSPRMAAKALGECGRLLRAGISVVIFPEGTRSKDGTLLPFNDIAFRLALREGVPVLPVVLDGAAAALPKNSLLFHSGGDVHVSVLPPVAMSGWGAKDSDGLRDHVWRMIAGELQRLRGR